ncbi:hypothetical protein AAHH78_38520, partial [Burkholderia pseudomallei]
YREEGWYLERTVHFIDRVGLDHVKGRVVDYAENRRSLWDRMQFALKDVPVAWHVTEEAEVDVRQFSPFAVAPAVACGGGA